MCRGVADDGVCPCLLTCYSTACAQLTQDRQRAPRNEGHDRAPVGDSVRACFPRRTRLADDKTFRASRLNGLIQVLDRDQPALGRDLTGLGWEKEDRQ